MHSRRPRPARAPLRRPRHRRPPDVALVEAVPSDVAPVGIGAPGIGAPRSGPTDVAATSGS